MLSTVSHNTIKSAEHSTLRVLSFKCHNHDDADKKKKVHTLSSSFFFSMFATVGFVVVSIVVCVFVSLPLLSNQVVFERCYQCQTLNNYYLYISLHVRTTTHPFRPSIINAVYKTTPRFTSSVHSI